MKEMDMIKDIIRAYRNYPDRVAFVIDDTSYTYQEVFARVQGIMPFVQDCPKDIIGIIAAAVVIIVSVVLISWYLRKTTPMLIQGTVECTTYKASSKVPGRIDDMKVAQGDRVEKGQLLYTLSTPELEAKLRQAEAVKSAAAALDAMALAGARVQQIEAAMNMWQKAQAGLELARKTYERVQNLYNDGVVPAQKLDEATANYKAMEATALAAKAQYDMATDGARKEDKEAAAARVRQAEGAVSEVESYISDAMVYSPVTGEISTIIAEEGELVGSGYPVVAILDMSDMWVTFNIKETLMPKIRMGKRLRGYVPALDRDVDFHITYIAPQADFATWAATRTQGGFDIRTFAVKAKPLGAEEGIRPGMSVLVDWDAIE